ncbi:hypothetical protein E9232_000823 [Inquilinus ginsengisoli]|uniref:Uncharacterized protein n=1 Tax=Inquilinus ginsengisoli TaxID=363840 RepID=A0ABU1JI79_9PROT|nr:hypothetical protein [Inquilinus ginsengisoli]
MAAKILMLVSFIVLSRAKTPFPMRGTLGRSNMKINRQDW